MLIEKRKREFINGTVYALYTKDGYPLEVTDTFLPDYTKMAVNENTNALHKKELGSRKNRWNKAVFSLQVKFKYCNSPVYKWR